MKRTIYLDYMASTPVDQRVVDQMLGYLTKEGDFANPASAHAYGKQAKLVVERARHEVADLIKAKPEEIIWTSGATEANNLAIKGIAEFYHRKGKHIITVATEHKSVLKPCQQLKARGFDVTVLPVEANGMVNLEHLQAAIRPTTILLSVMQVNNEIGVIQNIAEMGRLAKAQGVFVHCDAVQSVGKMDIDVSQLPVDLMSFSAHKCYGPKGIGALYCRKEPKIHLVPQIAGAGQELGLRSGTLPTHQIVAMGASFKLLSQEMQTEIPRLTQLRDRLWNGIANLQPIILNGDATQRVCNNLSVSFPTIHGEALMMALNELALSSGAACTAMTVDPSHVIKALGSADHVAHSTLRISLGRFTTDDDITQTINIIQREVSRLQSLSTVSLRASHA